MIYNLVIVLVASSVNMVMKLRKCW